jgi:tRNA-binding protein
MAKEVKPVVSKEESFDLLDIRVGKVLEAEIEPSALKRSYRLRIDFGGYGVKTSVARLTQHAPEQIVGKYVLAVLNFPSKQVGETVSECLTLGVQLPKVDSGEATFITVAADVRLGSKLS